LLFEDFPHCIVIFSRRIVILPHCLVILPHCLVILPHCIVIRGRCIVIRGRCIVISHHLIEPFELIVVYAGLTQGFVAALLLRGLFDFIQSAVTIH
jgi:hypothetical protein